MVETPFHTAIAGSTDMLIHCHLPFPLTMSAAVGDMYARACFHLLSFLGLIALFQPVCLAFNIDAADPDIYHGDENGFFGHKVLQFIAGKDKGFLVTAPLQQNGTGTVCSYMKHTNSCFTPQEAMPVRLLGLSLAEGPTRSRFTICSPSVAHECDGNSFLNGQCYQLSEKVQNMSSFKPAFQECTKKKVDMVFLFDGSASMTNAEFNKNKDFILDIMNSIKNSSIKFAAVQFSGKARKVFNFNDYQNRKATMLLKNEVFMQSLTNTYLALNYTLYELFENQMAGATPDATKVLVIITDGDPSDTDSRLKIVQKYDDRSITRFVIGVKNVELKNLHAIASAPKEINTFHISNYDGLAGILKNFEDKIFNIEDTKTALSEQLTYEMSQSGFSSVYHKGNLVLGSVGSNNWRGSLYELDVDSHGTHIQDPNMVHSSYMGYSVAAGEKDSVSLYFTGAPRFEHRGEVVLFRKTPYTWEVVHRVTGEQIGSYFGAELCLVDVQSDGNTDFLLVGAPLFHHPQEKREGQIYVYKLTDQLELESVLNVSVPSRGRFGTTISLLADLNGDHLRDVAVGAPLEDDNRGAVYIYLGNQHTGIRPAFSQRIPADPGNAQIRFFGQAVDGHIDLGEDGLPDLVVGSRGAAIVLRSKPVVNVKAHLRFEPAEISTVNIHCPGNQNSPLPMVTLTVCFDLAEATFRRRGTTNTGLNISYTLDVDPMRQTSRGFFGEKDKTTLQSTVALMTVNDQCFTHAVNMPSCVQDTLSPILIRLKYAQHESEKAANILNADSATQAVTEVPFEKNCRTNDVCIAELEVDFNFVTPTLVVVNHNNFNVTIRLSNHGDDSFNTKLYLFYPPGLSFSMLNLLKSTRPTLPSCKDLEGVLNQTMCGVSLPVYHSRTSATFQALFRIMDTYDWEHVMSMTITGKSDNNNSTKSSMTKSIPVQYQVDLTVAVHEDAITYLNFTLEDHAPKKVVVTYEVKNLGFKALPVTVSVTIPTKMEHNFEMNNYQVVVEQVTKQGKPCVETNMTKSSDHCSSDNNCKTIECETFSLASYSTTKVILSGEVSFKDLKQRATGRSIFNVFNGETQDVIWKSFIEVTYDKLRYVQASSKQSNDTSFPRAQPSIRVELIIPPDILTITAVGGSVGLVLLFIIALVMFKMGCFRRKTMQYYQEQEENETEDQMPDDSTEAAALETPEEGTLLQNPDSGEHATNGGHHGCSESPGEST